MEIRCAQEWSSLVAVRNPISEAPYPAILCRQRKIAGFFYGTAIASLSADIDAGNMAVVLPDDAAKLGVNDHDRRGQRNRRNQLWLHRL